MTEIKFNHYTVFSKNNVEQNLDPNNVGFIKMCKEISTVETWTYDLYDHFKEEMVKDIQCKVTVFAKGLAAFDFIKKGLPEPWVTCYYFYDQKAVDIFLSVSPMMGIMLKDIPKTPVLVSIILPTVIKEIRDNKEVLKSIAKYEMLYAGVFTAKNNEK